MNAPNVLPQKENASDRAGYEPSMEDILASIRRIISDEQTPGAPRAMPEPAPEPVPVAPTDARSESAEPWLAKDADTAGAESRIEAPPPVADVTIPGLEQRAPLPPEAEFRPVPLRPFAPERPVFSRIFASRLAAEAPRPPVEPLEQREMPRRLAPDFQAAAPDGAAPSDSPLLSPTTDTFVSQAFNKLVATRVLQSTETMNGMVREMLKPMLKAWLDDNLPVLVERLVRAEIERVARGGR